MGLRKLSWYFELGDWQMVAVVIVFLSIDFIIYKITKVILYLVMYMHVKFWMIRS